ncbi:hypothetical protein [Acidiphilium sp. MT5]
MFRRFIGGAELELDLIAALGFPILKQQVEAAGAWLDTLLIPQHQISKAEYCRIIGDKLLDPFFVVLLVSLEREVLWFDKRQ